ncbi:MAG TPA: sulfotransferase [Gemmataceae bacterium]|nr:sulfotransferase [Gemmataceae bacterium]
MHDDLAKRPSKRRTGAQQTVSTESPFEVPFVLHGLGGLVHRWRSLWLELGRLETSTLARELRATSIHAPIYVCGLARSGSTLLHEIVSSHPAVATHRVKDYPLVFTPFWQRRATRNLRPQAPVERAHQDGMMITTESPDALEEMVWMAFFPRCHDPSVSNVLGPGAGGAAFRLFYTSHIKKLLLAEGATRYAAKDNYHVARLGCLLRLFPDARFLLPVRAPADHIASLMRQQRLFVQGERKHPRALAFMRRTGHFEFGLDRRPIHLGDDDRVRRIRRAWAAGDEVRGLAIYWDMVYRYLARLLAADATVRTAAFVVRFESLCDSPRATLRAALEHCRLPDSERVVEQYAARIRRPSYYTAGFSAREMDVIREETAAAAGLWGY